MQQSNDKSKTVAEAILGTGDLLLVANKSKGKTNALMLLANEFRKMGNVRLIVFETFPKWINEFSGLPFMYIQDQDIKQTSSTVSLTEEDYFVRTKRSYSIGRGRELKLALRNNKSLMFCLEVEDTDRISFFILSVLRFFYRARYLKAYKYGLDSIKDPIVFVCEESQNLFDSSIISKKVFNRFRKMYSECRNFKIHFLSASQRLQDLNTKIRGRNSLMLGRVSLDDFELKISRLLRHSEHRGKILSLERGSFLHCPSDTIINFPLFQPVGKPNELVYHIPETQPFATLNSEAFQPQVRKEKLLVRIMRRLRK